MKKYAGLPDWLTCISLSILVTASNMEVSVLTFIILCFFQKATMHHKILQSVVSVGSYCISSESMLN